MEKPSPLNNYDDFTDPEDHVDAFEEMLQFHNVGGAIKCRLFPTTLRKTAIDWYKGLTSESIISWRNLKNQFASSFTASQ